MESPTILDQDEFQFQVRSCSDKRSTSSSTTCSPDRNINFSFHYVKPAHLCAYADEIFQNGKIRPLHSEPFEAVTVYAPFPHAERINVHEILEPCDTSSSAPSQYTHSHYHRYHASPSHSSFTSSEPAHATLHYHRERPATICYTFSAPNTPSHHHHTSPSHSHSFLTPHTHPSPTQTHHHSSFTACVTTHHTSSTARATTHPPHHATTPSLEPARATSYIPIAAKCRRALRLFRLCRASHVESSCPPSREPFTPHKLKDNKLDSRSAKSTTHLSNMTKLFRPQYDVGINKLQGRECHLKEAPLPLNIPSRVHPIVRSPPSPHAIHYHAQRAHKESMKNRTPSPFGSGLLGCISY